MRSSGSLGLDRKLIANIVRHLQELVTADCIVLKSVLSSSELSTEVL